MAEARVQAAPGESGTLSFGVALLAAGLGLRPQLAGVGPLIPQIQHDLSVPHAIAGLLSTIPILCMGLVAVTAPRFGRRYGSRRSIAVAIMLTAVAGMLRSVAPGVLLILVLTIAVGVGIGLSAAILPIAVKERFAHRPALATGVYVTGFILGSTVAGALAVPLSDTTGSWRGALFAFAVAGIVSSLAWLAFAGGDPPPLRAVPTDTRLPWRSGTAWVLVGVFSLQSLLFFGLATWLPAAFVERGWSQADAGLLLAVFIGTGLPATLAISWSADRYLSRRAYLVAMAATILVACLGFVIAPSLAWAWAAAGGVAQGGLFTMALTLPLDVAHGPARVGAYTGMMLAVGYVLAAAAPFVLGGVRDLAGSFTVSLWLTVLGSAALFVITLMASPARLARLPRAEALDGYAAG